MKSAGPLLAFHQLSHIVTDILFAPHLGCCFVVTSYLIVNRNIGQSAYHSVTLAPLDGAKALETSVTVG